MLRTIVMLRTAMLALALVVLSPHSGASQGPMLRADVQYPQLGRPAAFLCTANACSSPIFDPQTLSSRIQSAHFNVPAMCHLDRSGEIRFLRGHESSGVLQNIPLAILAVNMLAALTENSSPLA